MMGVVLVVGTVCEEEEDATNERPIEAKLRLFPNNPCNNSTTGRSSSLSSFAFVLVEDENSRCGNNSGVTSAGMVVVVEKSDVALLLLVAAMVMNDRSCSML